MNIDIEKIHELNELSSNPELNMPRMKELAKEIVDILNSPSKKEEPKGYEYAHLRVCDKGLQRESCRKCLFETLCNLDRSYLIIK